MYLSLIQASEVVKQSLIDSRARSVERATVFQRLTALFPSRSCHVESLNCSIHLELHDTSSTNVPVIFSSTQMSLHGHTSYRVW